MRRDLLKILRCPFCGDALTLEEKTAWFDEHGEISSGILGCQCSAYPIAEGIPYLRAGKRTDNAVEQISEGKVNDAFFTLMELEGKQQQQLQVLMANDQPMTFRSALKVLCPPAEGEYFLYRFSDPTFLISVALLRAVGPKLADRRRWMIDLCGGTGHLTSRLLDITPTAGVILGDFFFWKIWLAKKFVAPRCNPVCCNANDPLPFAANICSLVLCSGAFEYIWSRRQLANEMTRLINDKGAAIVTHTHNALRQNASEGMPLTPAGYRNLFETVPARLFKESAILDASLKFAAIDLAKRYSDKDLKDEDALICISSRARGLFQKHHPKASAISQSKTPDINPLYEINPRRNTISLRLRFPSPEYESEFIACKRYLPNRAQLSFAEFSALAAGKMNPTLESLSKRMVLLDLPQNYL